MKIGISTASLFGKNSPEDALRFFKDGNVLTAELFLQSFREYNKKYAKKLMRKVGKVDIHSIHSLTTQFEPTLYSVNKVAQADSFEILEGFLQAGKALGAKYYTFHGGAIFKKLPYTFNFDELGKVTNRIIERCSHYDIALAQENVHWGYYKDVGYYSKLKERCPLLKGTLDIKQARLSNFTYADFIDEMKGDIVTVHLSDVNENGKMCLPGKGITDFDDLFKRLNDVGFDGALLIEAYSKDFDKNVELLESVDFLSEKADKIFKK